MSKILFLFMLLAISCYSDSFIKRDENFATTLDKKIENKFTTKKQNSCEYIADPNIHERNTIKLINKYKLENEIYCTRDGDKLVYKTGEIGQFMQIGLLYSS